jgi:hypothetical protein
MSHLTSRMKNEAENKPSKVAFEKIPTGDYNSVRYYHEDCVGSSYEWILSDVRGNQVRISEHEAATLLNQL